MHRHAANALTLLRIALAPAFACVVVAAERGASGWAAALVFAVVAGSDVVDGRLARRFGTASRAGLAFDHGADILFLLTALGTYAALDAISWSVPVAVAGSFGCYVLDALRPPPAPPRWGVDRLGHFGGVANWVMVGVLIGNHTVGLGWLPPPVMQALCAVVLLYSAAAIVGRLAARR